jgi:hypothetical protein
MIPFTTAAQQVSRAGGFDLNCDADTAFPLFSPLGERAWIKDWDPRPLFPETIAFRKGTVFRQGTGEEDAVWTVVDADWQQHRAEYVRLAPASHTAHIVVKVHALGAARSHVVVSYTVTAWGERGGSLLEAFSENAYAAKMQNWQRMIDECLGRQQVL